MRVIAKPEVQNSKWNSSFNGDGLRRAGPFAWRVWGASKWSSTQNLAPPSRSHSETTTPSHSKDAQEIRIFEDRSWLISRSADICCLYCFVFLPWGIVKQVHFVFESIFPSLGFSCRGGVYPLLLSASALYLSSAAT